MRFLPLRTTSAAAIVLALGLTALPAQAATGYKASGTRAAVWQGTQLKSGHIPGFTPGNPDWGLTIDTGFMLAADGTQPSVLATVEKVVAGHVLAYAVYQGDTASGAMAKSLVASEVFGDDPQSFGGLNVRKRVLKLVAPASAGFEQGRLRDTGKTDYSNVFGQAYGAIGLARSGSVPQAVVDYLLKQRCTAGYFHVFETVGKTCDQTGDGSDTDATALALQALVAAKADGATVDAAVISRTADWLVSAQKADGSFGGGSTTPASNANSTGLAAEALFATGRTTAVHKAAAWVASVQITAKNAGSGPAKPDIGAIAYDAATLKDGLANGLGGNRSQWWRSTPQAFFALNPVPLGTLTAP